jgi:hypothetical protein
MYIFNNFCQPSLEGIQNYGLVMELLLRLVRQRDTDVLLYFKFLEELARLIGLYSLDFWVLV